MSDTASVPSPLAPPIGRMIGLVALALATVLAVKSAIAKPTATGAPTLPAHQLDR